MSESGLPATARASSGGDPSSPRWLSAHLYFDDDVYGATGDVLLRDVIAPFFRMCSATRISSKFFFIRYGDGGAHLRVRLLTFGATAAEQASNALMEHLHAHSLPSPVHAAHGSVPASAAHESASRLTRWQWVPYEAELSRYGGAHAMRVAEDIFHATSASTLHYLSQFPSVPRTQRLGHALLAMLVTTSVFWPQWAEAAAFLGSYESGYLRVATHRAGSSAAELRSAFGASFQRQSASLSSHVTALARSLSEGEELPAPFQALRAELMSACVKLKTLHDAGQIVVPANVGSSWPACTSYLLPSYLHMTNNRLGISIPEEVYLSHLIVQSLLPFAGSLLT